LAGSQINSSEPTNRFADLFAWRPTALRGGVLAAAAAAALALMGRVQEFLYFQF